MWVSLVIDKTFDSYKTPYGGCATSIYQIVFFLLHFVVKSKTGSNWRLYCQLIIRYNWIIQVSVSKENGRLGWSLGNLPSTGTCRPGLRGWSQAKCAHELSPEEKKKWGDNPSLVQNITSSVITKCPKNAYSYIIFVILSPHGTFLGTNFLHTKSA